MCPNMGRRRSCNLRRPERLQVALNGTEEFLRRQGQLPRDMCHGVDGRAVGHPIANWNSAQLSRLQLAPDRNAGNESDAVACQQKLETKRDRVGLQYRLQMHATCLAGYVDHQA